VHLSKIRAKLKMSESTMRRILAHPINPTIARKPRFGKQRKIRVETRKIMKKRLIENPSLMLPN
jgi:hypothetical protein